MSLTSYGPLIISIDAKGNNLFELLESNKALFNARKAAIVAEISQHVRFIK